MSKKINPIVNYDDNKQAHTIELNNKMVVLKLEPFNTDVDMDEYTVIHFHNIMGEILTCSVALNRIGVLLAEIEQLVSESKLDNDIYYAQKSESVRKEMIRLGQKPTEATVESSIFISPEYKVKKQYYIKMQKNRDIINSFYWALKDKSTKLDKISDKLRPEEFEKDLVEEKINGVIIKVFNKAIK